MLWLLHQGTLYSVEASMLRQSRQELGSVKVRPIGG